MNFNFLLTHGALSQQAKGKADVARLATDMTRLTLTKMALGKRIADRTHRLILQLVSGGINDQIGKGFHRYSTDDRWHVPHFEKMLYDQGQLAVALANIYAVSLNRSIGVCLISAHDDRSREMNCWAKLSEI